jgi:hypothetical protein
VLSNDSVHLLFILLSLLFLLSLKFLEVSSISEHLLGISFPFQLELSLAFFSKLSDFFLL